MQLYAVLLPTHDQLSNQRGYSEYDRQMRASFLMCTSNLAYWHLSGDISEAIARLNAATGTSFIEEAGGDPRISFPFPIFLHVKD